MHRVSRAETLALAGRPAALHPDRRRLLIAGGGLAGGLLAWRLAELEPELDFLLLERSEQAGGKHTWCFHQHDLSPQTFSWIEPLISASWSAHEVHFPKRSRRLNSGYFALRSEDFAARLAQRLGPRLRTGAEIAAVTARGLTLGSGETLRADGVLDARGPSSLAHGLVAWQKFYGLDLELHAPHGLSAPVLMDARVPQLEGFRFMYLLPWSPTRLLIEDTRYSASPALDPQQARDAILDYARARGWSCAQVLRQEQGCLPLPLSADFYRPASPLGLGLRSGRFHYVTGYSLPETLQVIETLLAQRQRHRWQAGPLAELLSAEAEAWRSRQGFMLLLNRLLFRAAEPGERWRVLARFYGLSEPLIRRFYAGRLTPADKLRLLAGRPPVPLGRAIACLPERRP